jgi:hypothetical protein
MEGFADLHLLANVIEGKGSKKRFVHSEIKCELRAFHENLSSPKNTKINRMLEK